MVDWNGMAVSVVDPNANCDDYDRDNGVENLLCAIERFSRKRPVMRFHESDDATLSIHQMIENQLYDNYDFWSVVQPLSDDSYRMELKSDESGEYVKSNIRVRYNPMSKSNLKTDSQGMFLRVGGTKLYPSYSDLMFYDNEWWKVLSDRLFEVVADEDLNTNKGEFRIAEMTLLTQAEKLESGFTAHRDVVDISM